MSSQVMNFNINCQSIFKEFGSKFEYKFDIVYNLQNILLVGLKDANVTVIPGDLTEDSIIELKTYHVDTKKWKDDITNHLKNDDQHHEIIKSFFKLLPSDFQAEYRAKFGDENIQIKKMKRIS